MDHLDLVDQLVQLHLCFREHLSLHLVLMVLMALMVLKVQFHLLALMDLGDLVVLVAHLVLLDLLVPALQILLVALKNL